MKFLIFGDLHGKEPKLFYDNFDAIIAPGDFCSDNLKKYIFKTIKENIKNSSNIPWYKIIGEKKAKELIKKSISDGRKVLEKLNSFDVPVYIVPGNWDWTKDEFSDWNFLRKDNYKLLLKGLKNIKDVHNKIIKVDKYQIIGYGINSGPEYPVYKEDLKEIKSRELAKIKKNYEQYSGMISSLFKKSSKPVIFLSHNVPFNTKIDRINNRQSPRNGYHYGSLIVREMINKYQPLLNIAGHMHENFGKCKVGKTVCINSGHGNKVNTFLEIENNKIKRLEFHR